MGRFYRGIIEPSLRQYTVLGDAVNITDGKPGNADVRWVFTEDNPSRALEVASALAAATRVMKGYNDTLSQQCLTIAETVWNNTKEKNPLDRVALAVELLTTTRDKKYADFLIAHNSMIAANISRTGWQVGKVLPLINDDSFKKQITDSVRSFFHKIQEEGTLTPYGVPIPSEYLGSRVGYSTLRLSSVFFTHFIP